MSKPLSLRFGGPGEGSEGEIIVDLDRLVTSRLLIQAESGGGKSWMIRYLLEETHGQLPHILFDLEGEFGSLRERYPYVLVSATEGEGDLPARPDAAKALCRRLSELGASAILDLFDLDEGDQQRFVRLFLEELLSLPRSMWTPRLVIVDEADRLAPEKGASDASAAINSLAKRGRKRGLGAVLAVQRLSDLDKGAAGGLQNKLIGLTTLDTDVKRAGDALGFDRPGRAALQELAPGHFFGHGPAIPGKGVVLVRSGEVATTHGEAQEGDALPPPPAPEALSEVLEKLAASLEETAEDAPEEPEDRSKVRVQAEEVISRLEAKVERLTRDVEDLADKHSRLEEENARLKSVISEAQGHVRGLLDVLPALSDQHAEEPETNRDAHDPERDEVSIPGDPSKANAPTAALDSLPSARRRILRALKDLEFLGLREVPRNNLAVFANQGPKSSAFRDHLAALKETGMISYPSPGSVALDDEGWDAVPEPASPRSVEELHRAWYGRLPDAAGRIVAALVQSYPEGLSRERLAEASGQSPRSSAFRDRIAELRSLRLVEYPKTGYVRATELLFPKNLPR